MKKKVFSKLLMVALVATVGVFSSCKDYDDDISDVRNNLSQTATELQADYNNKINVVNTNLEKLQTAYDNLEVAYQKADAALKATLETTIGDKLAEAKAYTDAAKGEALTAAQAAEQAAKDYAAKEAAAAQAAAIGAAKELVGAAQKELSDKLAAATELIAKQGTTIENLISANAELSAAVQAAQARANEAYALAEKANTLAETNKANLEKAAADIAALQTGLANLQGTAANKADVAKLQSDLAALQKTVSENVVNLADYKENITKLSSDLAAVKDDLAKQVGLLGESIAAVKATAEGNVAKIEGITSQLATLSEANTQAHEQIIGSINTLAETVANNKTAASEALAKAVEGLEAKLAAANKLIETNDAAIRALIETKASELKALIDGNADLIKKNAEAIQKNADEQKAENIIMKNGIAKNAQDIIAQGKDITRIDDVVAALQKALGKETAETLKAYAESVANTAADKALLAAQGYADEKDAAQNITIMDAIKQQAAQDAEAWDKAIQIAIKNLITTYELATLKETLQAYADHAATVAQGAAETNAAATAQKISDNALDAAMKYTDKLAQTLADNYTTTKDMQDQIAAAQNAAIATAYKEVLNKLLDGTDWATLIEKDKDYQTGVVPPSILKLIKDFFDEKGLNPDQIQNQIDNTIAEYMKAAMTKSKPAAMGEPAVEAGIIMGAIEAAAAEVTENLNTKFGQLDARLAPIEKFLGETLGTGDQFTAAVNAIIATNALAKQSTVDEIIAQLKGEKESGLKTLITKAQGDATANATNIALIASTLAGVNETFSGLKAVPAEGANAEDAPVSLADALTGFSDNIEALVERVNHNSEVIDNLQKKVISYINDYMKTYQTMITSINLFANQHMAERDEQYKLAKYNSETKEYEWPFGWENFDHTLTFCYAVEQGIFKSCKYDIEEEGSKAEWNYPEDLLKQIQAVQSERDDLYEDYNYYKEGDNISFDSNGADFVHGRYRTWSDSILVRVSPTNADLAQAEIALLNSKGEDIIAAGLVEKVSVSRYAGDYVTRFEMENTGYGRLPIDNMPWSRQTRAAEGNETGLWVIKFKLQEDQIAEKFNKYTKAHGADIVYAVAVKNTDFETEEDAKDRYVVSEYDLSLALEKAGHAYDFTVNNHPIDSIHNRYITPEQGEITEYSWDDDPESYTGTFRYELTWHEMVCPDEAPEQPAEDPEQGLPVDPIKEWYYTYCWNCCYDKFGAPKEDCKPETSLWNQEAFASSTILFKGDMDNYTDKKQEGVNTCDRHGHSFDTQGVREMSGTDNRHLKKALSVKFDTEMDGAMWAKIHINFPVQDNCGKLTPIRGFFVTLDQHFALESDNSEINAWTDYIYKNVAKYSYNNGKRDERKTNNIHLFEGNEGDIYIKDANNIQDGDVIGFRVHAVNLDGTITDPDGRAFYVMIGNKQTDHYLSFDVLADTLESYAVQNKTVEGAEDGVIDNVNGLNPIATFNANMTAAKKSVRFFNNEPYTSQFDPKENIFVEYSWREGNPAIRSIYKMQNKEEDSKVGTALWPVAGTGNLLTKNAAGIDKPMIKRSVDGKPEIAEAYGPETFFDFWYSLNENATAEDNKDNSWTTFNGAQPDNKGYAPNKLTKSMRASIKAGMANHLLDGQTYKITMTIKRLDSKTGYVTINSYDIDITKVMPTGMPAKFSVKSESFKDANATKFIYVRPFQDGGQASQVEQPIEEPGNVDGPTDPWKITWGEFVLDNPATSAYFATLFNADKFIDKDDNERTIDLHGQRWAVDARPFNFDEMFNGLHVDEVQQDETTELTFDKNYYFVFEGAGSLPGAEEAYKAEADWAKADAANAGKDAITVYNTEYTGVVNPAALDHSTAPAYFMPEIHWSKVNGAAVNVKAGYIYRDISATLNEKGTAFLVPSNEKSGKYGLSITNDDYEIAAVPVNLGNPMPATGTQVKVAFKCAFDTAIGLTSDNTEYTFNYNEDIVIDATKAKFKLNKKDNKDKWAEDGGDDRGYFNAMLPIKNKAEEKTLAQMIATPWEWVDINSLKVIDITPSTYRYSDYHYEPSFMVGDEKFDPAKHTFQQITKIGMVRRGTSSGLPDYNTEVTGKFSFDVYNVWFHKKTVTLKFKKKVPTNQASRQAK
ncbi:MAG: hypothetical protein J6Y33_07310 [Prevotella sp.]|nr:hypothetical protein [Prevotella sp.]